MTQSNNLHNDSGETWHTILAKGPPQFSGSIFPLEGSIGAGKTTLLKQLETTVFHKKHKIVYEQVDDWMNLRTHPKEPSLFELYYQDKQRYGFTFQMYALQTRFQHLLEIMEEHNDAIIICERCFLTDCEIFAKMLHDQQYINDTEFCVYKKWYDFIMTIVQPDISGIIYLQVQPNVCAQRIKKRSRKGEENIDLVYLTNLHEQHENWLRNPVNPCKYKVHVVDGSNETTDIKGIVDFIYCSTRCS